jgi:hypothetical protein
MCKENSTCSYWLASSVLKTVKKFKNINRIHPEQQLLTLPTKSLFTQVCELSATVPLSQFYSVCTVCDWKAMHWLKKITLQSFCPEAVRPPCNNPCSCITYFCFSLKRQCHVMFFFIFFSLPDIERLVKSQSVNLTVSRYYLNKIGKTFSTCFAFNSSVIDAGGTPWT